jgi:glycosyltransferase involved in cell wall biosynthesis
MKIALVHDYIKEYGGAEKVLETLHEIYPNAPIYTTVYLPKFLGPHKERFAKIDIRPSILQYLPFKSKLISPIRLIAPIIFKHMDFSKYDVVIVSATGAYQPNMINKGKAIQICYCHTPPRYLYGYATARDWKNNPVFKVLGELANHFLRMVDFKSSQNVDFYIANSQETASRIKKFYRKEAIVINPPVDIPSISHLPRDICNRKYFLTGGRLARAKHPELSIKACTKLNLPLKVFGKAFVSGYEKELQSIAGKTVEFVGEVNQEEKYRLMAGAKAFIFPSEDEDFGITPVEAMACGTSVIAHNSGGVKETVISGKTGVFFDELTTDSLAKAIKQLNNIAIKPEDCISQAKKFSKERFVSEIRDFVQKHA